MRGWRDPSLGDRPGDEEARSNPALTPQSLRLLRRAQPGADRGMVQPYPGSALPLGPDPLFQQILFGGEKGAQSVPQGAGPGLPVDVAKTYEKAGADASYIFHRTGWYRGPDGDWKWILSDKDAALNPDAFINPSGRDKITSLKPGEPRKLPDVLNHPTLYQTYPQLKDATVERTPSEQSGIASYDPVRNKMYLSGGRSEKDILSSILHEVQHGVQKVEGFGEGGNSFGFLPADVKAGKRPSTRKEEDIAFENYLRLSGETEARQVQRQFEARDWSELPTRMKGSSLYAPAEQLVRRGNSLGIGKQFQEFVPVDHDPFNSVPVNYDPFKMKPVDYDPFAPATNAYEQALQEYPILRDQGIVGGPGNASQRLEFWPAHEPGAPDRPRPGFIPIDKPGVELGTGDVRPIDVLGDVVSHHMVDKDPVIKKYYERFTESITPEQQQRLQEQYQHAVANEGETRPYDKWEENSGMPAYFRGYAFQQWPQEFNEQAYTPEQRGHFDRMMNYLSPQTDDYTPY